MSKIKERFKKFIHSFKRSKIKMVHESDLIGLLGSLGVLEKIEKDESFCTNCKKPININNIEAILSNHGEIQFVCSSPSCAARL